VQSLMSPVGQPLIALTAHTPVGVAIYFMSREEALSVAGVLKQQAMTGPKLITPPTGLAVPR
jgi:hypothetical protein